MTKYDFHMISKYDINYM